MADDSGIDPRYAAQFQRGFDPARHEAVSDASAGPQRLAGGPAAHAERVPDPPRRATRAEASTAAEPADAVEGEGDVPRRRAPATEWALLGVGVLLTLGGPSVALTAIFTPGRYSGLPADPLVQSARLLLDVSPGPLLVAGLVAVSAWLAVRGIRRAR